MSKHDQNPKDPKDPKSPKNPKADDFSEVLTELVGLQAVSLLDKHLPRDAQYCLIIFKHHPTSGRLVAFGEEFSPEDVDVVLGGFMKALRVKGKSHMAAFVKFVVERARELHIHSRTTQN